MSDKAEALVATSNQLTGLSDSQLRDDARIFRVRRFLLREFPVGLTRASHHLQIYDNYITNTRLSLRKQRDPHTNERVKILRRKEFVTHDETRDSPICRGFMLTEMLLSPSEYEVFSVLEANETRKNRYWHTHDGHELMIDFYLGDLLGLTIAAVNFADEAQARQFNVPELATVEVTHNETFGGAELSQTTLDDLRRRSLNKSSR